MSDNIPNTEYITITSNGIFVGGRPATKYRDTEIWDQWHVVRDFKAFHDSIMQEYNLGISEMHVASTRLPWFTEDMWASGDRMTPILNDDRIGACFRVKCGEYGFGSDDKWIYYDSFSSAEYCNGACAHRCVGIAKQMRYLLLSRFFNPTLIFQHPAVTLKHKKEKVARALADTDLSTLVGQQIVLQNGYTITIAKSNQSKR